MSQAGNSNTTNLSRRAALARLSVAAAAGAVALPAAASALGGLAPQTAGHSGDAELRRLWEHYLARAAARISANEKLIPARAAFDAEMPPCPKDVLPGHHFAAHYWLWQKHGLDRLNADWNAATNEESEIVATIQRTQAEGIIGIGIKLAALPAPITSGVVPVRDNEDRYETILAALVDIDRLAGTNLVEIYASANEEEAAYEELPVPKWISQ
jgi:hypothetical protein